MITILLRVVITTTLFLYLLQQYLIKLQAPYVAPTLGNYLAQCHNNINEFLFAFIYNYLVPWRYGRSCQFLPPLYSKTFKAQNTYDLLRNKKLQTFNWSIDTHYLRKDGTISCSCTNLATSIFATKSYEPTTSSSCCCFFSSSSSYVVV